MRTAKRSRPGLTEDITTSLSKFHGLSVVAPQSARAFKDSTLDVRQIAERLGARYVVGGSVRKSRRGGSRHRATDRCADRRAAVERDLRSPPRRLGHLRDPGRCDRSHRGDGGRYERRARAIDGASGSPADLDGRIERRISCCCGTWGFQHNPLPGDHAELRAALESKVAAQPDNPHRVGDARQHLHRRALALVQPAARSARPRPPCRAPRDRAGSRKSAGMAMAGARLLLSARPGRTSRRRRSARSGSTRAMPTRWRGWATSWTHAGEYDRGCALTERAMAINPGHPGWLHFAVFNRHFARGEYADALNAARRVNIPEFMWMHFAIAAAAGHLGRAADGRPAADAMMRIAPFLREDRQPARVRDAVVLARGSDRVPARGRAALAVGHATRPPRNRGTRPPSGSGGAGGDCSPYRFGLRIQLGLPDQRPAVRGARVRRRHARRRPHAEHRRRPVALRLLARDRASRRRPRPSRPATCCRAPCESPVTRCASSSQLTEAASGASLWAETYDRDLGGASLFDVQDALTATIVATIADANGALVRSMANVVRGKQADATDAIRSRAAAAGLCERAVACGARTGPRRAGKRHQTGARVRRSLGGARGHVRGRILAGVQPATRPARARAGGGTQSARMRPIEPAGLCGARADCVLHARHERVPGSQGSGAGAQSARHGSDGDARSADGVFGRLGRGSGALRQGDVAQPRSSGRVPDDRRSSIGIASATTPARSTC